MQFRKRGEKRLTKNYQKAKKEEFIWFKSAKICNIAKTITPDKENASHSIEQQIIKNLCA